MDFFVNLIIKIMIIVITIIKVRKERYKIIVFVI